MKKEWTESSETMAYKVQKPGNNPEEIIQNYNLLPSQAIAARLFQGFVEASVRPKHCTSRFNDRLFAH